MNTANFPWACFIDMTLGKSVFEHLVTSTEVVKFADTIICSSSQELELDTFFIPEKFSSGSALGKQQAWPEDLAWLDQQPASSVVYVAFGFLEALHFLIKNKFKELL